MPISCESLLALDHRDHAGMQHGACGRDEERRGHLLPIEHPQDPRQAIDRAVLAAREDLVIEIAGRERRGGVVDVEGQAHRHASAVGPRALQPLAGADVKHLRLELVDRQLGARQRIWPRLGGAAAGAQAPARRPRPRPGRTRRRRAHHRRSLPQGSRAGSGQTVKVTTPFATWVGNCCKERFAGPFTTVPEALNVDP